LRLKILKKLRTVSLNSKFTGSYKKSVNRIDSQSLYLPLSYLDLTVQTPMLYFSW